MMRLPVALTARVDKQSCQSSGRCIQADPEAFGWDADHLAEARGSVLPDRLLAIARDCPALAISLVDDDGRELDPFDPRFDAPASQQSPAVSGRR